MNKRVWVRICTVLLLLMPFSTWALSIAVIVWRGETEAEKGFIAELEALGHEVDATIYNAEQNKNKLAHIVRNEISDSLENYDYIYSFGTTASKTVKFNLKGKKPHIFNIVTYPADAGILPSEQGGQYNTAGVSSRVLTVEQITAARKVIDLKKVAVVFNPRELNSSLQVDELVALGREYQFEVVPIRIRPDKDIYLSDLKKITEIKELSAIYLPSDSFLISHAKEVLSFINENKIPSVCAVAAYLKHGCLMGTVASYEALGRLAASIVDEHIKGKPLADIPVKFDVSPQPVINEDTRALLQL